METEFREGMRTDDLVIKMRNIPTVAGFDVAEAVDISTSAQV